MKATSLSMMTGYRVDDHDNPGEETGYINLNYGAPDQDAHELRDQVIKALAEIGLNPIN